MKFPKLSLPSEMRKELCFDGGVRFDGSARDGQMLDMCNLRGGESGLTLRPSLRRKGSVPFIGVPDRYFAADGITAAVKTGDSVKAVFFDRQGGVIDSVEIDKAAQNALLLIDKDRTLIYLYGADGASAVKFSRMGSESAFVTAASGIENAAYVPTVSVGATGYLYEEGAGDRHYAFNGKMYESKNLISDKYSVKLTSQNGLNVYVLPYPIEEDTQLYSEYTDNSYATYDHALATDEEGKVISGSNQYSMDGIRLNMFGDDRRTLIFEGQGEIWQSKDNSPWGNSACNRFNVTVTAGFPDDAPCTAKRCTLYRSSDGERTWIAYGSDKYPSFLWLTGYSDNTYFPVCGEIGVGDKNEPITAAVQIGERVAVLKERSLWLGEIETGGRYTDSQLDISDTERSAGETVSFVPKKVADTGCDCPDTAVNCDGRLVWLCSDGTVRMLTSAQNPTERNVRELSYAVAAEIKKHTAEELKSASAAYCGGKYCLLIGDDMFVLDCKSNAMDNYTAYADDLEAQKKLCWYKWNVAVNGIVWSAVREGDVPLLYGKEGDSLVCCSLDGDSGFDLEESEAATPIMWRVRSGMTDFGQPGCCKTAGRLTADVFCDSEVKAALFTENGCGACVHIPPSNETKKAEIRSTEKAELYGAAFEGSGKVKISGAAISCRKTAHKA